MQSLSAHNTTSVDCPPNIKGGRHAKYISATFSGWYVCVLFDSPRWSLETRIMNTKLLAVLSLLLIAGQLTGEENKKSTGTISYIIGTLITISCTHIPVLMYVKIIDKHVCHLVSYVHRVTIDFTTNIHLFSSSHSYLQVREECWVYTNIYTTDYHQLHSLWWH